MKKKRILAIDGGGIKGVFPASFLATVEDSIGDNVGNYFDLIVGTSTGGIIALGLGLGIIRKADFGVLRGIWAPHLQGQPPVRVV